jgi:hypothetical protein
MSWPSVLRRVCGPRLTYSDRGRLTYWVVYGLALARVRGRQEDAVRAFRRAEVISPQSVLRYAIAREVLAGLLGRVRRESPIGRELRGIAFRAGLSV